MKKVTKVKQGKMRIGLFGIIITIVLIFLIKNASGQKCKGAEIVSEKGKDFVKQADEIIWYGMDLSLASLNNSKKINFGELIRDTHCPTWIERLNKEMPIEKLEGYSYFGKKLIYDPVSVQERYKQLNAETWVTYYEKKINEEEIRNVIKEYKLPQSEGIGCVLIIESLNKPNERTTAYLAYFDIESRDLYWLIKTEAKPDGWGMTKYWSEGFKGNLKCALRETHKKEKENK